MIEMQRRELGKHPNEGARLLWERLKERGWSQTRLANELPVAKGIVWRWLYCTQRPDGPRRALLEDKLKIHWRAWDEPPVSEFTLPLSDDDGGS